MLKNYLKVALRNLWKNKAFSAINVIGLSAGLGVCLLIVLYVADELSFDRYNANADRIYRLDADIYFNGTQLNAATSPEPLAPTLVREYPDIVQMARLTQSGDILIKKDNQNIQNHHAIYDDSTFFSVFTIPMIQGNPKTALNEPHSIVIDETSAKKYFNSTDVLGKTLYVDNSVNCKITGVIKDIPQNSHFHFSYIRPFRDSYRGGAAQWLSNNGQSYILVKAGASRASIQGDVDATINKYLDRQLEEVVHASVKDMQRQGSHFLYHLMPLEDIHLRSDKSYELEGNGNVLYVLIFSAIAAFILVIACVNFMNLSTARSANRAKEVGIRKVAGSLRSGIIFQFLTESVLIGFFSLLVAIPIACLLLPLFNQLSGKQIRIMTLFSSWMLPVMMGLVVMVGCLAGSYPAFYLSSFQPVQVLKGAIAKGFKNSWLRSSLVFFQFCISIMLIVGTIVIYKQLNYIRNKKIGYNRDQVLILHNAYNLDKAIKPFRQELIKMTGVEKVSITGDLPTSSGFNQNGWFQSPTLDPKQAVIVTDFGVDEFYVPTLGMEMAEGRNFSHEFLSDSSGVIINQAAEKLLGFNHVINQVLYRPGGLSSHPIGIPYHVIGVVKDFNYSSMHDKVSPLFMRLDENWGSIAVRIKTHNIPLLLSQIERKWSEMSPGQPYSYTFMDNDFNNIYDTEQRTGKLFITFALFAIFIATLGLFGLVTYAAEQRIKEIGIRKVLGASIGGIVAMLSKDFLRLVVIASVIAFPIAWWFVNKWLQSFAFRTNIQWWMFFAAGLLAVIIALITVSLQAFKAAVTNPVKSLRAE